MFFLAKVTAGVETRSFKEAMIDDSWRQAISYEIQALEDNGT